MKQRDILALMDGIAPGIAASFAKAIAPVLARLDAAERRVAELEKAPADIDIDSLIAAAVEKAMAQPAATVEKLAADLGEVQDMVTGLPGPDGLAALVDKAVDAKVATIPPAAPGKDADPEAIATMVRDAAAALMTSMQTAVDAVIADVRAVTEAATADVKTAIAELPVVPTTEEVAALVPRPQDGKDADPEVIKATVAEVVAEAIAAVAPAKDGQDATPEQIAAAVEKVLATWDRPKDGESVTVEQLRPLVDEAVAKRVAEIPIPKDGVGLAGALKDHEGCLVLTLTDGTVVKLGRVDGRDGNPGLGFDDLAVVDDGTEFVLCFVRGEQAKEFRLAKPTLADCYREVWKPGAFKRGDAVTWGGSLWIAQRDTEAKPETNDDWKLAVKRGRDGKDGVMLEPKAPPKVKL